MSLLITEEKIIVLIDIDGYNCYSVPIPSDNLFKQMNNYYSVCESIIAGYNGELIKGIGDAVIAVFPKSIAPKFIHTANTIKTSIESWWSEEIKNVTVNIYAHIGVVSIGTIKTRCGKTWKDIFGKAVNEIFLIKGKGVVLSEEVKKIIGS